jgi:hypothetical protein
MLERPGVEKQGRSPPHRLSSPSCRIRGRGHWGDTIIRTVKSEPLLPVVALALLAGACPKRQTTARLVYVPTPAAAASSDSQTPTEAMIVAEPAPPEPAPEPAQADHAPQPAVAKPPVRQRRPVRAESPSTVDEAAAPPVAEVPPLEPRATSEQQERLRGAITGLQTATKQRISRLDQKTLAEGDHKTLDDAGRFLAESERALAEGDLQRSHNLAHKASLLVDAVERNY